ncbi:pLS20_p028 family conjugation system transmembrane protein [Metabacillus sp. cB07]|uniref:pLS20_p028 family conjugation system transmembrane protein n=1 Tax=Metabacillus sp. cB07 TaxID=2806989 RepID=UPI00193A2D0D|nr:hypothetical protein [Metabacillus sp. cB07]
MDDVSKILERFSEFLEITGPISYMLREIGWIIIRGLAFLVDSLSNITNEILGLKNFFNDTDVVALVEMLLPLCGTLMGLSFLYTGYLIIFQKKVDREGIVVNMFLALVFLTLLGTSMEKANKFTDVAIDAIDVVEEGSISQKVVSENLIDLAQFDRTNWKTTELNPPNQIPKKRILNINITQAIDKDFDPSGEAKEMSKIGIEVLSNRLEYDDAGYPEKKELEDGWFTAFKEKYYRWHWNFWTIAITLAITAFTMLTISIKLAKLFFELAFNYVLATIIAPADIHSGQKTKQVLQSILNIFFVTIMIFLSMKVYILGTGFITERLDGVAYLVALFAFSLAVIDGPNMVERLFGIDAGLKSSYGALAGAYAGAKGASRGLKGLSSAGKSSALKGVQGVAGVAGMAQGLTTRAQDKNEEQSTGISESGSRNNQSSEEIDNGKQEVSSSLEQEMEPQEPVENNVPGLHQEMASKGFSDKKQSAAVNSPHSISSGSPSQLNNGDLQKNEKISGESDPSFSSSPSFSQSNYPFASSEMQEKPNNLLPLQEKKIERDTRDLGQSISDQVQNNSSVKTVKRTYQIGQNTGENIRKNIAKYRRDRQN